MAFRFFALIFFFGLLYSFLGFGIYRLQIEKSFYYFAKAQAQNQALIDRTTRRGQIFFTDRNDNLIPVALNRDYPIIYADPQKIDDLDLVVQQLAFIINWEESDLRKVLSNSESLFALLVRKASPDQVDFINSSSMPGIYISSSQYRFYPFQDLASQLLGFVGVNKYHDQPTGLYGVEEFYNSILEEEKDIQLTIDRNIQAQAEQILAKLISDFKSSGGTIIVQEPNSGQILALAGSPGFDPNNYGQYPIQNFLDPAVQYIYEPGSIFKPLTMAAGINSGALTPETKFFDTGSVTLNNKTIRNWDGKAYGEVTMTDVIKHSINTGAVFAEQQIGHQQFYEYLKKFGFTEKSGIDLPNEIRGNLRNLENKKAEPIDFATASFGQGVAITPISLINAFSAIANGGILMRPYVNSSLKPYVIRRVISEETSQQVMMMMGLAVEGAKVAAIHYYQVAGKTGTAQIPDFKNGGYSDELIHNYVGLAPISQPRFVILIKLDRPSSPLAGLTVVPAFRELAEFILNYYNVPPDKL